MRTRFAALSMLFKTSRDRPKSAPYLRLKNSKSTSKVLKYSLLQHPKFSFEESLTMPKNMKGGPFGIFQHPFCRKTPKNEGGSSGDFFPKKVSQCRKKLKGGPLVSSGIVCYVGNLFGSVPWTNRYNLGS